MDFQLSEEQAAIRDMARAFAADHFAPNAARWDAEEVFPVQELRMAAELGLAGIYVSDDVGGAGLGR
ncbi:MAG: acyl-CoA dehydrogenase family protein, partial [Alphaproteobacteria bacterium]|nr:acyl-CoA dehydrogenase family protein [Alphaproteobacteria bacterium]